MTIDSLWTRWREQWIVLRRRLGRLPLIGTPGRVAYRLFWAIRHALWPVGPLTGYHRWRQLHCSMRARATEKPAGYGLQIDLLTLTYDTAPVLLRHTAASVFAQDCTDWRWVIWDNGSRDPGTLAVLAELERDTRVTLQRHHCNLGITGGHRAALQLCSADYVAFLDHDDLLRPDAIRTVGHFIHDNNHPDFLYSDEDKLIGAVTHYAAFFKPDFSPALLQTTPYPCHLAVARRAALLDHGVFTDPAVEGTQDWDLVLRLWEAGCRIIHIPEILYTWRSTPSSTAGRGSLAKPYIIAAQRHCLEQSLERRGLAERFDVRPHPLFQEVDGHWHAERRREFGGPPIEVVVFADRSPGDLDGCLRALVRTEYPDYRIRVVDTRNDGRVARVCRRWEGRCPGKVILDRRPTLLNNEALALNQLLQRRTGYLAFVPVETRLVTPNWLWEAVGCFELNPDAVQVGGRQFDPDGTIAGGGVVFGIGGKVAPLYDGFGAEEQGYYHLLLCQRNVSAVLDCAWVLDCDLTRSIGGFDRRYRRYYEVEFGARCRRHGLEIIATPLIANVGRRRPAPSDVRELSQLQTNYAELFHDDPYYSPSASLDPLEPYQPATPNERCMIQDVRVVQTPVAAARLRLHTPAGIERPRQTAPTADLAERRAFSVS